MGLFDIFKKNNESKSLNSDNGVLGPTYLEKYTIPIDNPKKLKPYEWRRKISYNGLTKFKIKYYGDFNEKYKNLIVASEYSRPLIFAIDIESNQEILLWDGCKYGYNPIFCDEFLKEQIENRKAENIFIDSQGKDIFEINISTYNQFNFDEEMGQDIDSNGFLVLENGQKIAFDDAKRNGFDCIFINITNEDGETTEIVSEELS